MDGQAAAPWAVGLAVVIGPPDFGKHVPGLLIGHSHNRLEGEGAGSRRYEEMLSHCFRENSIIFDVSCQ